MEEFKDAVVLVTGAASGIGLETARAFAENGALVIGADLDEEGLKEADAELGAAFTVKVCSVARDKDITDLAGYIANEHGRLDVLVNNAGVGRLTAVEAMTEEDFYFHYDVNVKGPMLLVTRCLESLRKSEYPSIVNVSSSAARCPQGGCHFLYSTTKAALLAYTEHLARNLPGIRANAVLPGWVDTPIYERAGVPRSFVEEVYEKALPRIPSGRIGTPRDIADCILFLCSRAASYVNGAALDIGGGVHAGADFAFPF